MEDQSQEKMQEIYMELQMVNQHLKQLHSQQEMIGQQTMEIQGAIQGLDEFSKTSDGSEILLPLSSGIFIKAKVANTKKLLMNVGAGVCVSKDLAGAKGIMARQLEDSKTLSDKIDFQLQRFAKKAQILQHQLQAMLPRE